VQEQGVESTPTFDRYADGEREARIRGQVEKADLVGLVEERTPF
jgi:hypothetical protein